MALDHYVSQVHLRHFCLPDTGRLLAIRKADGKQFEPRTQDVCRIAEGNTNSYLADDRAIEEFLKEIEPKYNPALDGLLKRDIAHETIFTIAGFVSAVYSCAPTTQRLSIPQLQTMLGETAELMDKHGKFDELGELPKELGAESLTEALRDGKLQFKVDPKYPQAVSIAGVMDSQRVFGNSAWDILTNDITDSPFLTSDYPIGLEHAGQVNLKVVPLTPRLAIKIYPNIYARDPSEEFDMRFGGFRFRHRKAPKGEVSHINRTIVRCAEQQVFCSARLDWIDRFVERNANYRLETVVSKVPKPDGNGSYLIARQQINSHTT